MHLAGGFDIEMIRIYNLIAPGGGLGLNYWDDHDLILTHLSVTKGQANLKSSGSNKVQPSYKDKKNLEELHHCHQNENQISTYIRLFYLQRCKSTMHGQHFGQLSFSIINLKINILNCESQRICQICFTYQGRRPRPTESELLYGSLNPLSSSKPSILTATKIISAKIKQQQNLRQPPSWEPSTWWAPTNGQLDLLLTANSWSVVKLLLAIWRLHADGEENMQMMKKQTLVRRPFHVERRS